MVFVWLLEWEALVDCSCSGIAQRSSRIMPAQVTFKHRHTYKKGLHTILAMWPDHQAIGPCYQNAGVAASGCSSICINQGMLKVHSCLINHHRHV